MTEKPASQILDQIKNYAQDNKGLLTGALAAAGAGGLAGGYLSSKTRKRPGEGRGSRRMRILRDALLMAGAGGAAVGLGGAAYKNLANALPKSDTDPVTNVFTSPFGRGAMGAGAGGGAWWLSKRHFQNPEAMKLITRAKGTLGEHTEKGDTGLKKQFGTMVDGLPENRAKERLGAILESPVSKLVPHDAEDLHKINKLGLPVPDGLPKVDKNGVTIPANVDEFRPGISERLPNAIKGKVQGLGKSIAKNPVGKKLVESKGGELLKRLSQSAYRHPGVAGAITAGALAPELIDGLGMMPGIPNPLHRE